jgi:branched-chain amino acid transport system substrate-binding protein
MIAIRAFRQLAVFGALLLAVSCERGPSQPTRIGAILPLTGAVAFLGEPERNALLLAVNDAKAQGYNVELVVEDSKGDATTGASAANRLVAVGVKAVIVSSTGVSRAAVPVLTAAGVITFAQCMDPTITQGSDKVFRIFPSYEREQEITVDYLKRKGYRSVALLYANNAGILPEVDAFRRRAKDAALAVVYDNNFEMAQTDVRTQIQGIRHARPDVLLILGYGGNYPIIMKQLKESHFTAPVVGNVALEQAGATQGGTEIYEGVAFPSLSAAQSSAGIAAFRERYRAKYGAYPGGFFDYAYFYDAFMVLARVLSETKGDTVAAKAKLTSERFDGLSGSVSFASSRDFFPLLTMARYVRGVVRADSTSP